jgi:two-component system, NarL family, sensor histidine kinase DegS
MQESMRFYVQLITRAQEEERKRLARELHDELSSSLLLLIQRLDSAVPSGRSRQVIAVKETLEDVRSRAVESLEQVRRYVQDLRPRILDDLGLSASLEWMADDMQKNHGIKTAVSVKPTERAVPVDVQLLLFRIAQEALSNVRRHAKARSAAITLELKSDSIRMVVSDDGRGFKMPPQIEDLASAGHLGIMGMTERAKLLDGNLEVVSHPGKGTSVITTVPLR